MRTGSCEPHNLASCLSLMTPSVWSRSTSNTTTWGNWCSRTSARLASGESCTKRPWSHDFRRSVEATLPPEIVGREVVLTQLTEAWSAALEGRGSALCLVGDSGIGKSRLAQAVLHCAVRDSALIVEVDCTPSTGNSPLLPIGVVLRRMAGIHATASETHKERAATLLLTRLLGDEGARTAFGYLAPLSGIQAPAMLDKTREELRAAIISTIVAMVRTLAAHTPLIILCEDLHWADDTTAQLTQRISQSIEDLRALLIVTRWPKAVSSIDLDGVTASFTTVAVEPLHEAHAAALVRSVAGRQLEPERVDIIVNRCGGVPLLLEEVTRSTLEHTSLADMASPRQPTSTSVPPELQLVVESRLGRWPTLKRVVEAASVLGREFPVPLLEAMLPGRRTDVSTALSVFADHGLFSPSDSGRRDRASFRHALIRDAVYETLVSREYLRSLHAQAADILVERYLGTPDASPDILAQHLRLAGRPGEAIRIRLAAGEDTFERGAYVEAMGHCDAAGLLLEEVGDEARARADRFRLCVLRGMVATGVHGFSAKPAETAYLGAQAMFDDETGAEQRYPVARGLAGSSLVSGALATAYRYSVDALELSERSNRPDYRIDAMSLVAYTTLYFGRLDDCRSWIERCLTLYHAERGETLRYPVPQDAKTAVLAIWPTVLWLLGDPQGTERAVARGLQHVERLGREFDKAWMHGWIAGVRYTQRRYADAVQHASIAFALGREHKFQEWEAVGGMLVLLAQSASQPAPDAVANAIATGQAFKAKGIGLNASYFLWGIARGLVTLGHRHDASNMLTAALDVAATSQETRMHPEIWILKSETEPDLASAVSLLTDAYRLAEAQGAVATALRAAATLIVRQSTSVGAVTWARTALDRLNGRSPATSDNRS